MTKLADDMAAPMVPLGAIPVPAAVAARTACDGIRYDALYRQSLDDPDSFWRAEARRLDWLQTPTRVAGWSFDPVDIRWFEDGVLNLSHNAVDRHVVAGHGGVTALIIEPDDPADQPRRITYAALLEEVIRMAGALRALGVPVTMGMEIEIHACFGVVPADYNRAG